MDVLSYAELGRGVGSLGALIMQRLLIDRFRGVFLGVAVWESHLLNNDDWCRNHVDADGQGQPLAWCEAMALGQVETMASSTSALKEAPCPIPTQHHVDEAYLIARILPAALFFHEDLPCLETYIRDHAMKGADPDLQAELLRIGVAIALLCKEQATPQTLIPQLLAQHSLTRPSGPLQRIQMLLQSQASLAVVAREMASATASTSPSLGATFAIACYCWASTADAFALTLTRTLTLSQASTGLIACALSGVFNGMQAIPLAWQAQLAHQTRSRASILSQADQLFRAWSGYWSYETSPTAIPLEQTAVSAPGLIRPRG